MQRRSFLKAGLAIGAYGLIGPKTPIFGQVGAGLARYADPLPIPAILKQTAGSTPVIMTQFTQKLHRDLQPTTLWGYNGTYPGPTIEVKKGTPASFLFQSNLPPNHLLAFAVDHKLHGQNMGEPEVRNVVHLHGARTLPESDGYAEAWFTPGFKQVGAHFKNKVYTYPNEQPGTTLWYHDHALGISRLNVYSGLAGFYIIRDPAEDVLNLPKGDYEIPLMIQDKLFKSDGSLDYPIVTDGTQEVWIPEFFGDTMLVNGKCWPYLEVEPRKYRFRTLNGCNARFLHMNLMEMTSSGELGNPGPMFIQIGSDGGLLPAPVHLTDILMAPAERFDLVIDFSGLAGKSFVLTNDGAAPYPGGGEVVPTEVMQFRVTKPLSGLDTSRVPAVLAPHEPMNGRMAVRERNLELSELDRDSDGYPVIGQLDGAHWSDPVTENPQAGSIEVWNLVNTTGDAHPIHVHLVEFHVLERQMFSQQHWDSSHKLVYTGRPQKPARNERPARKDVVVAQPGMVTKIAARFDLPPGTRATPGQRFRYMWHCHILEHEDNEMMRPFDVVA
jgi:spore coat protein A, manganese oxidase